MKDLLNTEKANAITVTELNTMVHDILTGMDVFSRIAVKGEISNFVHHRSGHFYFSLKDEGGLVRAVMFRSAAVKLPFVPENGMKVIVYASLTTYIKDGQYQLMVTYMEPDGVGALYLAFEQLKKRLAAEGLFDPARKKPIPKIPKKVGLITSPTGAAVRDMIHVLGRRFPFAAVMLYPALVQGADAPQSLIRGLHAFEEDGTVDVIIIGRGGGSAEDLWCFNDETLARAVAACAIPVISAVGHETDFTICDFVADLRAPTPSAAAELAVPDTAELKRRFHNVISHLALACERRTKLAREKLGYLATRRFFAEPSLLYSQQRQMLDQLHSGLAFGMEKQLFSDKAKLTEAVAKLEALSPLAILKRGYAVPIKDGKTIKTKQELGVGETFTLRLSDGDITACRKGDENHG